MTKLNSNMIYKGDCAKLLCDKSKFPSNSVDLIMTSPPYGIQRAKTYGGIDPDIYVEWFEPIGKELHRILKPSGSFILNIKEKVKDCERETYVIELILSLKKSGWLWIEEFCWFKKNSFPGKWKHRFRDNWERCLHFAKSKDIEMYQDAVRVPIGDWSKVRFKSMGKKDFIRTISGTNSNFGRKVSNWLDRKMVYPHNVLVFEEEHYNMPSNLLHFSTECNNRGHSAAFPVELPSWFIKLFTKKGGTVLDPFMGSGTTAMASLLLGRNYLGIEAVEDHVLLAQKNIKDVRNLLRNKK
jgi:site-specific DNA-methyltransferase (adenine-specific)